MTLEEKLKKIREAGFTPVTVYKVGTDEIIYVKNKPMYPFFYFSDNRLKEYPYVAHPEIFSYMKNGENVIWGKVEKDTLKHFKK